MPLSLHSLLLLGLLAVLPESDGKHRRQVVHYPAQERNLQTRSLSGTYSTDGHNETNKQIYDLITLLLFKGFAIFRVKAYNDRVYLEKYRRSYWFGDRYYAMDNLYYLATRDTCSYHMTYEERKDLVYEDGVQIYDIVYQCQRYVEYCCGLNCCRNDDFIRNPPPQEQMQYPWSPRVYDTISHASISSPLLISPFLLLICGLRTLGY